MTTERVDRYRRLIEMHDAMNDPLVMIRTSDLRALLDCYEWQAEHKPRVRRPAAKEATP